MMASGSAGGPAARTAPPLLTLLAGALGGALCGLIDGTMASFAMVGAGARGVTLPLLGFGMTALTGLLLAAAFVVVELIVRVVVGPALAAFGRRHRWVTPTLMAV
ncbi:MAG TPA: hypothetical protein VGF45_19985, partial [Polyangia bacterium]